MKTKLKNKGFLAFRKAVSGLHKQLTGSGGAGLLEVLFTNVIIMVGMVPMVGVMFFGAQQIEQNRMQSLASELAQGTIEQVMNERYDSTDSFEDAYGTIPGYPEFRRLVLVTENSPVKYSKTVRIAVLWRLADGSESTLDGLSFDALDPDAHPSRVEMVTLKSRYMF